MTTVDGVNGTVCNATQYFQSLQSRDSDGPLTMILIRTDTISLVVVGLASSLSCICLIIIFIWIGWNVHWYKKTFPNGNWKLFQRPADIYMFSLFLFDLIQAIGSSFNIKWVLSGIATTGPYCTAQGVIVQIGDLGVALITILLAIHTFVATLWQVGLQARGVALGMVCLACIFIVLWVTTGSGIQKQKYWCWIYPQFPEYQVSLVYISVWIVLFASVMLYIPLYFWAEGRLSVSEEGWYKFHMSGSDQRVGYAQRRVALGMLFYPLASSIVFLPLFITRCVLFSGYSVPLTVMIFRDTMSRLSGAIDVLLFLNVRRRLLLFPRPGRLAEPDIELAPQGTRSAALPADEGSGNSSAQIRVSSKRISDDI